MQAGVWDKIKGCVGRPAIEYEDQYLAATSPNASEKIFRTQSPNIDRYLAEDGRIDFIFMQKHGSLQAVAARELFTNGDHYGRVSDHTGQRGGEAGALQMRGGAQADAASVNRPLSISIAAAHARRPRSGARPAHCACRPRCRRAR